MRSIQLLLVSALVSTCFLPSKATLSCGMELPTTQLPNYNASEFIDLDSMVEKAQFVNFAESSHGLVGMHLAATRMFRYLVETKGFRVLIFESAWGVDDAMQRFLQDSNRTTLVGDEHFFLNAFSSTVTLELLLWIREFNRLNPTDSIRLGGYQPEQPVTDLNTLWGVISRSDKFIAADFRSKFDKCKAASNEFRTDLDFVLYVNELRKNGQLTFNAEQLSACHHSLNDTKKFLTENREELTRKTSLATFLEAEAHLFSFRSYLNILLVPIDAAMLNKNMSQAEMFELGGLIYEEGDKARFEIFQTLYQTRYKDQKVMFWMHNWHAMKDAPQVWYSDNIPKGTISLGTRLARVYSPRQYIVIGSVVACPRCKTPMRPDALETNFAAILGNGSAIVDAQHPKESQQKLALAIPGSVLVQSNEKHLMEVVLNQQFDVIYYLSQTKMLFEK